MNSVTTSSDKVANDGLASLVWFYHKSGRIIPKTKFLDWFSKGVISGHTLFHTKSSALCLISVSSVIKYFRSIIHSFSTHWSSVQTDVNTLAAYMDIPKYSVYRMVKSVSSNGITKVGKKYMVDIKFVIEYLSSFVNELEKSIATGGGLQTKNDENSKLQVAII